MTQTPGPWSGGLLISDSMVRLIAMVQTNERSIPGHSKPNAVTATEAESNARLIAAAPDLLQVCEGMLGYLAGLPMSYRPDDAWFKPISEAIAKAKGT